MVIVLKCQNVSGGKGILFDFVQCCFKQSEMEAMTKKKEEGQRCDSEVEHLPDMCETLG